MSVHTSPVTTELRVTLFEAFAALADGQRFVKVLDRGEEFFVELYAPVDSDHQSPHDQDELYIVATGTGTFRRDRDVVPFGPGDLLYVAAHVPHRFESFSPGFKTWVIFFGPKRRATAG